MSGTMQAILLVLGVAFIGFAFVELIAVLSGAVMGLVFPALIGGALIYPAVRGRKERKRLKSTFYGTINR